MTQICDYPEHDEAIKLLRQVKQSGFLHYNYPDGFNLCIDIEKFFEKYKL
jgi:hypothetical protein